MDRPLLVTFQAVQIRAQDLDRHGCFTRDLPGNSDYVYKLRRRINADAGPDAIVGVHAGREVSDLQPFYNAEAFGIDGHLMTGQKRGFCLMTSLSGATSVSGAPIGAAVASGTTGIVTRPEPGMRFRTEDGTTRLAFWVVAARLQRTLQARLGEPLRDELSFSPSVDWAGPGRAVWRLINYLLDELRDPDGLAADPVARETFTDLFAQTMLNRLPHNYTPHLTRRQPTAIPGHLRRAEAFMTAAADQPISLADVAEAAGCRTGTLNAAFRQFRGTTPLAALHGVRLQCVRDALLRADEGDRTGAIARRFGFSNPSRFIKAYGDKFGERPAETRCQRF